MVFNINTNTNISQTFFYEENQIMFNGQDPGIFFCCFETESCKSNQRAIHLIALWSMISMNTVFVVNFQESSRIVVRYSEGI